MVYTHRSNVLHAMTVQSPDAFGIASRDTLLPVVPLFHANGWSTAFASPLAGAAMVLPGRDLTPPAVYEMLELGVTISAAVPTVWMALLAYLDANGLRLSTLERVAIGGSSCPRAVIERFQDVYGVRVMHAWGMTEMSPIGTLAHLHARGRGAAAAPSGSPCRRPSATRRSRSTSGSSTARTATCPGTARPRAGSWRAAPPWCGATSRPRATPPTRTGWFDTGDMATIDGNGYVRITDRAKDVIKSGGEWISSIELENAAVAHPDVAEAAAVGGAAPEVGRAAGAGRRRPAGLHARPRRHRGAARPALRPLAAARRHPRSSRNCRIPPPARSPS